MNDLRHRPAAVGFHSGALAAQRRAGVHDQAARLARMVGPGELRVGIAAFLADAACAAITARDRSGRLWTSLLLGPPGFLRASGHRVPCGSTRRCPAQTPCFGCPSGSRLVS
jgi:hypothetical protein